MKKLFLVALCSLALLTVARAEEGSMKQDDTAQRGNQMKQDDGMGHAQAKTGTKAKKAGKKTAEGMKQGDSMMHGDKMQGDKMDQGSMK